MKKYQVLLLTFIIYTLPGCTLVDYDSTKTESPAVEDVTEEKERTLETRISELEQRVKELEEKLKAQW